ncbi:uncharacterized protein EKO05_0010383 [Ascochyta rabiei]|uniref:uncharacterized protein n=1 Tax=Didymella rabiei TaxID=5454 RepID=UPI001900044D|nr:uncharacterized protein EKO05_0010383 [Ascochyta rabiei]UPX20140.1 hypothetical protein EKO05_0010383 [Ascochyta rabiei]
MGPVREQLYELGRTHLPSRHHTFQFHCCARTFNTNTNQLKALVPHLTRPTPSTETTRQVTPALAMSTRRTRRAAATAQITEEVTIVETRAKRTRGGQRKAATTTKTTSTKVQREQTPPETTSNAPGNAQTATRSNAVASTPAPAPAPATSTKRRLRSTQPEAASPLRALDEQPAKKPRTASKKASAPAPTPAKPEPAQEEEEETGIFFSKSFDVIALELQKSSLEARIADFEATCNSQRSEISQLRTRIVQLELENRNLIALNAPKTPSVHANTPTPEFDSFDVDQSEPAFVTGSESAMALLRHVQEAAKLPKPTSSPSPEAKTSPAPNSTSPVASEKFSTPSRRLLSSFTSPFTAIKNLFGSSTPQPPSPTPSRLPPADTITEVLSMPPTPVGERTKRSSKKTKKPNRLVRALLQGVEEQDADKATAWAKQVAADFKNDSAAGDKRKRLEAPVLYRDLKHLPSSKPWQSGFSFPEDVLDLEDDEIVPAWAVYISMVEEEREAKKTKMNHATFVEDDMPASLNEVFGASTTSALDFQPRRSIDPSPMFDTPLHHQEGGNVFKELRGHDAAMSDRENLQRELKAGGSRRQTEIEPRASSNPEGLQRTHDPIHGSFSVPDSDSEEEEEEVRAQPVWTQAPPPAPTPSHAPLPASTHNEEVERQRQKLMKHTPHKPSRLQQVSYPSPSLFSDAGNESILAASPAKFSELFGDIPDVEPLDFSDDPELEAAVAAGSTPEALQRVLATMNWSVPTITYDSDEEELSPI